MFYVYLEDKYGKRLLEKEPDEQEAKACVEYYDGMVNQGDKVWYEPVIALDKS